MNYGKTLDGAVDLNVDNLEVNESSRLGGTTAVEGEATFEQDMKLENLLVKKKVTLSAGNVSTDYTLKLPPNQGDTGGYLVTDGFGNSSWQTNGVPGAVSYIGIVAPTPYITVNGLHADSTTSSKTFNLELGAPFPVLNGIVSLTARWYRFEYCWNQWIFPGIKWDWS